MTYRWTVISFVVAGLNLAAACYSAAYGKLWLLALNVVCALCVLTANAQRSRFR